ncbi:MULTISPECIES: hypothetical protein [unclassified Rhodococcus (in: high G+C Gram-positive bacteria)]|uniref:hypothetical protein n=1 Tax=unclassified Rhodococcus (in: high G+C Gram-positive bacteria) TaxID=192944 RepID=UPI002078723A|nr:MULTISPECIES: hypothetical protein [unclassified Rhodococcus (in: high G+C Gram-positive bacteria)]
MARLFAIREVAVGAAALQPDPTGHRLGLAAGVLVDSAGVISDGVSATGAVLIGGGTLRGRRRLRARHLRGAGGRVPA